MLHPCWPNPDKTDTSIFAGHKGFALKEFYKGSAADSLVKEANLERNAEKTHLAKDGMIYRRSAKPTRTYPGIDLMVRSED